MSLESELEQIRAAAGGILYPKHVVDFARNENTELHSHFEWEDSIAAENWRIWQARQIIKVVVTIIPTVNEPIAAQVYVSMKQDRYDDASGLKGGYRSTVEVLSTPVLRITLLEEALEDLAQWQKKYQSLVELAEVFIAISTVQQKQNEAKAS
jgi:uncharacterized protein (DUF2344 family)